MEHIVVDFGVADPDYNLDLRQVFTDPNITTVFVMAGIDVLVIHDSTLAAEVKEKGIGALLYKRFAIIGTSLHAWEGTTTEDHGGHYLILWKSRIQIKRKF